jgi:MFS family permease
MMVVLTTIITYYQQYVGGAVGPSILAHFQMTFRFYLTISVVSSVFGMISSLLAGLADRWGRANMIVFGLLVASLTTAFAVPNAKTEWQFAAFLCVIGFMEGVILVASPALVRDFSPQVRRGAAMGFWTLGPVIASLIVSEVASNTLGSLHPWEDQYHIAGITGLVMFVIAFFTLRELSPQLRDQVLYSLRERVVIEARARGINIEAAISKPWRQMVQWNIVVPALGVSLFLLIYISAVAFFVIYFSSVFGFTQAQANGLGNWFWAADAVTVVTVGILSDRIGVRKPIMIIAAAIAVIMTAIFATRSTHPATSYDTFIVILVVLSASRGAAYAPWMASFTETIETRNPALVATGLAVWGWTVRLVTAVALLVLPFVVTSATTIVDYAPQVQARTVHYAPEIATAKAIDPATLAELQSSSPPRSAIPKAVKEIVAAEHVAPTVAIQHLLALKALPASDRAFLSAHGRQVLAAKQQSPKQWEHWWLICMVGQLLFIPTIFLLVGRWRPSVARRDLEEHERLVEEERKQLAEGTLVPA